MKTTLIKPQDEFILLSDEKVKVSDFAYHKIFGIGKIIFDFGEECYQTIKKDPKDASVTTPWKRNIPDIKKIIAGIPELPRVDLSNLKEEECIEIRWVDVEKLASLESIEDFDDYAYNGFIKGFKTAQSLNDNMFSLDDMRKAFEFGLDFENGGSKPKIEMSIWEEFIESLQQTSWDVKIEMEKTRYPKEDDGWEYVYRPKITNNSIKVIRIL